jgi:hypothetical protein
MGIFARLEKIALNVREMLTNLDLFNYAEIVALLTSILRVKWLLKTPFVYFIPYMLMTVAAELLGRYTGHNHMYALNNQIFNISTVIEFLFFYYLFYQTINRPAAKNTIVVLSIIYFIWALINIAFVQGIDVFDSYTMLLGTLIIILFVFFYFYDAFDREEPVNLIREPMFWISIGIFLFYLGDFTFNLMYPYLAKHNLKQEQRLFQHINNNLIVFEYLCFSAGLILCNRNRLVLRQQL